MMTNAFKNSRSGYTLGCPRPRFVGGVGIGTRSTNWTNVTSNESWNTMRVPPILVAFNYHNNRSTALLGQPPAWLLIYDQASIKSTDVTLARNVWEGYASTVNCAGWPTCTLPMSASFTRAFMFD